MSLYHGHFTHNVVDDQGELVNGVKEDWGFDKRVFLNVPPPRNLSLPPPGVPESVVCLNIYFSFQKTIVLKDNIQLKKTMLLVTFIHYIVLMLHFLNYVLMHSHSCLIRGYDLQVTLVNMINKATADIPNWDALK